MDDAATIVPKLTEMNNPREANFLIVVGDPRDELPHKDLSRAEKFHKKYPDKTLMIIVWDRKDYDELAPLVNKDKCLLHCWEDDEKLLALLMENMMKVVGAMVVQPTWYTCKAGHVTPTKNTELISKCDECGEPVEIHQPYKEKHREFAEILIKVAKLLNFDTTSGEYLKATVNPMANVLRNMRYAFGCKHERAISGEDLMGSGKGKPILLCAAGPSLDKAIPHLKRLQDKCLISCVGRAFKKLRMAGIKVDYTISVEMYDWDCAIFGEVTEEEAKDTTLLYASVSAPKMVEMWRGPKRCCLWDIETAAILGRKDWIMGGNSVAHHQLNFAAQVLGCEPIVLVGNDLGYSIPQTHAEGTSPAGWPDEVKVKDANPQSEHWVECTNKGNDFHPLCHMTAVAVGVGFSGKVMVKSSPSYECFATLFSILIAKHGKKCYNSCPNGQKINGTEYLDLETWNP